MIQAEVERSLRSLGVRRGHVVIVAYSTGPDSTALLALMCRLRRLLGIEVIAAYFDHGIRSRPEIASDISHARITTDLLAVPLITGSSTPEDLVSAGGPEAEARAARYRFLKSVATKCSAKWIAVGHTVDDRAETVLMRALQGTGVSGIAGMHAKRGCIIRPLEALRRDDLKSWLRAEQLSYRSDSQNDDQRFIRNRVRRLLGEIERSFPAASARLADLGRQAEATQEFVATQAAEQLPWMTTTLGISLFWQHFQKAPAALQLEALYQGYDRLLWGTGPSRLPRRFLAPIQQAAACDSERVRAVGHGVVIERVVSYLVMSTTVVQDATTDYLWKAVRSGSYKIPETNIEIRRAEPNAGERTAANEVRLGPIDGQLFVRSCRPGDEIRLHSGVRTLRALLREWGTPEDRRWMIPVVVDSRGVLAVCGAALGYQDEISKQCGNDEGSVFEGNGKGAVISISCVEEES